MACGRCWDFEVAIIGTDAVIRLPVSRPRWVPAVGHVRSVATVSFAERCRPDNLAMRKWIGTGAEL